MNESQTFGTGRTDRLGEVRRDTRPGRLQMVWVTHPDHALGMWMEGALGGMVPGVMEGPEDPTIRDGRQELVFRLEPTMTVYGRITGPRGEPVIGARVSAVGAMITGRPALSDPDGRYELLTSSSPGPGDVVAVFVVADGYIQDEASMAASVPEGVQGDIEHDVRMEAACVVSGRVLDELGAPIVGAEVRVSEDASCSTGCRPGRGSTWSPGTPRS